MSDEPGQPGHATAGSDRPDAHLPLREDGRFLTDETHIAGEHDLTTIARRRPTDESDGNDGRACQAPRTSGHCGKHMEPGGMAAKPSSQPAYPSD
jgi:hypothetical protein